MNKYIKYGLLTFSGAGVLLAGSVAYVAATFNPGDYKQQIIQVMKDKNQRTLKLDGNIKLTFFPFIGAELGALSLSEYKSDKSFASIEGTHVSLAFWPLLSRRVVVDKVAVNGLKATVVKFKNGKSNIDDLLENDAPNLPIKFDIASVQIEKAELNYRNDKTGIQYSLKDLNLKTGRIASSLPVKVDFAALIQANQPKLDMSAQIKTTLTFDLDKQLYKVEELDLQANGTTFDIGNLVVQASGDASANLSTQEFSAKKLAVSATGIKGKDNFDARLDAPALNLTKDNFSGDKLTINAKLDGAKGSIAGRLTLPGLDGNAQFFKSSALTLELDITQPGQTAKMRLSSPVAGNFEVRQFNLSDLTISVNATSDKLPNKLLSSEMKGSVQVDGSRQSVQASLAGGLLQSQIKAKVAVNNFFNPAIRFDVDVDQLDADFYIPKTQEGGADAKTDVLSGPAAWEKLFALSALKKLNLEGSLRLGTFKVANIKSSQARLDVKARNGTINFSPLSANLYQGSLSGSVTVNTVQAVPGFVVNEKFSDINIAALLKDAANFDILEGKGNVSLDLRTQGSNVSALTKALNGNMTLSLTNGAIKGINIAKALRDAGDISGKQPLTHPASKEEKTNFSEMKASFKVGNGVAHNDDLLLKSPLLRLSGNGEINFGNDSIDYLAKTTVATTHQEHGGKKNVGSITVPVRLSGSFSDLKYTLNSGKTISNAVKAKRNAKRKKSLRKA
jgi:AsmA protein